MGTSAFDRWEIFCPDCKTGVGLFNHWPVATPAQVAKQDERDEEFKKRLEAGEYLDVPSINRGIATRIKRQLEGAKA